MKLIIFSNTLTPAYPVKIRRGRIFVEEIIVTKPNFCHFSTTKFSSKKNSENRNLYNLLRFAGKIIPRGKSFLGENHSSGKIIRRGKLFVGKIIRRGKLVVTKPKFRHFPDEFSPKR